MERMLHDLRYGIRSLKAKPGFTALVLLALVAAFVPAQWAARIDPLVALKN